MITIKEKLVAALQDRGYGFFEACEHATNMLHELNSMQSGQSQNVHIGDRCFKITKK